MKYRITVIVALVVSISASAQYDILKYGAIGDGKTINTKSVQAAIDACTAANGGTVIVPTGVFIIGTIHLKNNVHLFLEKGGVLRGSTNLDDYEIHIPDKQYSPVHKGMLFTEDAENVTISGEGQIDGNGDHFFKLDSAKKIDSKTSRFTRQKDNYRKVSSGIGDGPVVPLDRPYQMFVFSNCKRVTVRDIFITKSPFWCMHFADCDAVNVSGIRLWNNLLAPNADGIDITSCTNVTLNNCDIRAGDDAIVVTGYDHHFEIPGYKRLRHPSGNIVVTNCNLQSYSSGIRIGFLDQNSVSNIHVSNCNITNSTRGIGIFLRDEGSLDNMTFDNISIETVLHTGDWWGNGEPIHISAIRGNEKVKLGKISHVQFSNIIAKGENGILVYGTPESVIENLSFDHVSVTITDSKLNGVAGGNVDLRGGMGDSAVLFARDLPGILIQYAKGVTITNVSLDWSNTKAPFFTHGLETDHVDGLYIRNFTGAPSPANRIAYKIYLANTTGLITDDTKGLMQKKTK
ncbi:MAG: glycosyl hydrolase family 28 protein [Chitinophagaceae bacterium]